MLIASIEDPVVIHKILEHLDNPARAAGNGSRMTINSAQQRRNAG